MPTALAHPLTIVGQASEDDAPALARTLALAFQHDPVARWFLPRDEDRLDRLERGFESIYLRRLSLPHHLTYTSPDRAGAALWIPPGAWETGTLESLRLLPHLARAFGRDLPRALRGMAAMEAAHPREPHYYLPFVGVRPTAQGRGLGTALLRPMLERCDREGMAAYLEATSPRNRVLYERLGFALVEEMPLPGDGPPLWRMWREPESA
jgi:GNAT superfamily N-acetyltransferase